MAHKIIKGVGGLLGIGGKKKTAEASTPAAEQKGPVVTPLGNMTPTMRRRLVSGGGNSAATLGIASKLGG